MIRPAILFLLVLLAINSTGLAAASSGSNIEDRIRAGIGYIVDQYASGSAATGFLHGANGPGETQRMYSFDNGIVALALSTYQQTHSSEEYYSYLKAAVQFLQRGQTSSGDFYQYFDISNNTWGLGEQLYYWNSYALMGAAYAAYTVTDAFPAEKAYWTEIVNMLRLCVDYWIPRTQSLSGQIMFSFPGQSAKADLAANAAMLVALIHIALFEYYWGDVKLATNYAKWSQSIAIWLYSIQERNATSWGRGGFYHNATRTLQLTFENGLAMFGLNSYYKGIGVLLANFHPSISDLRETMMNWAAGYVEATRDSWNGPQYGRSAMGILPYPKETLAAASLIQALVDVWINIGGPTHLPGYWSDAQDLYEWMTGSNELSMGLQQARDIHGGDGGFYAGIQENGANTDSDLTTTALTVYAMARASYIEIFEFPWPPIMLASILFLALLKVRWLKRDRSSKQSQIRGYVGKARGDMSGFDWPSFIWSHAPHRFVCTQRKGA
jgi:hypothetical protein